MSKLSLILKSLRANTGDSLREMARKLDISPSYLSSIENEKRDIPSELAARIVKIYCLNDAEKEQLSLAIMDSSSNVMKVKTSELSDDEKRIILAISNGEINKDEVAKMCEVIKRKDDVK